MRVFSPWEFDIDPVAADLLERRGLGRARRGRRTRPAARSSSATSSRWPRCRRIASALHLGGSRVTARHPRRDRQAQGRRSRRGAVRADRRPATAPSSGVPRPRGDRRLRHLDAARTRSAPAACPPRASARTADRIAYGIPDVLGARPRPLRRQARAGRRQRALGVQRDPRPRRAARLRAGHRDRLGDPRRRRPAASTAAAATTSCPRAARSARPSAACSTTARSRSSPASRPARVAERDGRLVLADGDRALGRRRGDRRRPASAPTSSLLARAAARPRRPRRGAARARSADRPEPALLRLGAAARRRRALPPRRRASTWSA